jgi:hypothetical protein
VKVPRALAGERPSPEQWRAICLFLLAHSDRKEEGLIISAKLANEAIDWYNEEYPHREAHWNGSQDRSRSQREQAD